MLNKNPENTQDYTVNLTKLVAKEVLQGQSQSNAVEFLEQNNIDWARFKEYVIYHDLISFAYASLKECFEHLPSDLYIFLKNNYYANILRHQYLEQEFFKINEACADSKIIFVPIKGMGLFCYYDNLSLRQMSDIDILVNEKDFSAITEIFYRLGYEKDFMGSSEGYWRQKQCHVTFCKKGDNFKYLVDVHWALDFMGKNKRGLPRLWDRVKKVEYNNQKICLLSDEDAFLALALHNRRFGKPLCLKNICDTALILKKCSSDFDWNYILGESNNSKLCATVAFTLYQMRWLLGINVQENIDESFKIPPLKQKLMKLFIEKNAFKANQGRYTRELYLRSHFLLYDNFCEPLNYIFNIPIEQFAKFYKLKQESKFTKFCYRLRWLYMPLGYMGMKLKGIIVKK